MQGLTCRGSGGWVAGKWGGGGEHGTARVWRCKCEILLRRLALRLDEARVQNVRANQRARRVATWVEQKGGERAVRRRTDAARGAWRRERARRGRY